MQQGGTHEQRSDGGGPLGRGAPLGGAAQPTAAPGWYQVPDGRTLWWDGVAWHQAPMPTTSPEPYRNVAAASVFAQAALGALALVSLFTVWAQLRRRQAAIDFAANDDLASALALDDTGAMLGLLSFGYLLALVAAAVAVPILCYRVHHNLRGPLGVRGLDFTPGWAAGWWFVPFANFVMPYRVVKEAWRASEPSVVDGRTTWQSVEAPSLLGWWWATFVVSGLIGRFDYVQTDASGYATASSIELSSTIGAFGSLLLAVGAVLAIVVFRQVVARQQARARIVGIVE